MRAAEAEAAKFARSFARYLEENGRASGLFKYDNCGTIAFGALDEAIQAEGYEIVAFSTVRKMPSEVAGTHTPEDLWFYLLVRRKARLVVGRA